MFLGFAGGGFKQHETALITPGQEIQVGDYVIRHNAIAVTDDERKQMVTADMTVLRDGVELTKMYPARWFFRKHEDQPTTEVAIRRSFAEDLYIVMPQFDAGQQSANVEITVTPLVNWVWLGFGVMALGTLIALLPETAFAFATARVPERARRPRRRRCYFWRSSCRRPSRRRTAHPAGSRRPPCSVKSRAQIICMCGAPGCVRATLENCPMRPACHGHSAQLASLQKYIDEGKNHDAILSDVRQRVWRGGARRPEQRRLQLAWHGCCRICSPDSASSHSSSPHDAGRRVRRQPVPAVRM